MASPEIEIGGMRPQNPERSITVPAAVTLAIAAVVAVGIASSGDDAKNPTHEYIPHTPTPLPTTEPTPPPIVPHLTTQDGGTVIIPKLR